MTMTSEVTASVPPGAAAAQSVPPPARNMGGAIQGRIFSILMLTGLAATVGSVGQLGYRAATDSFVAPAILSPDSDAVLASKLKARELEVERARARAELEGIEADLAAADKALRQLAELKENSANALHWTSNDSARKANAARNSLGRLGEQNQLLANMIREQRELTGKARDDLAAGVIS